MLRSVWSCDLSADVRRHGTKYRFPGDQRIPTASSSHSCLSPLPVAMVAAMTPQGNRLMAHLQDTESPNFLPDLIPLLDQFTASITGTSLSSLCLTK